MKKSKLSVKISLGICWASAVMLVVMILRFPAILAWMFSLRVSNTSGLEELIKKVTWVFYALSPFIASAIYMLIRLLMNLRAGKTFVVANAVYLKALSWCLYAVGLISAVGTVFYTPYAAVAFASGLTGTLLRVISDIMRSAAALKTENDLTI